ncbi:MAG: ribose-5-phosphate isomerase RpiA [Polyangiaceae bacterium]
MSQPSPEALARAALRALDEVKPGMRLGLGTGRAAEAFIRRLGQAARDGLSVTGVATSERSAALAKEEGIRVVSLADDALQIPTRGSWAPALDVAFDGADEVAPDGSLTKGLGGAMLRERVVATEASRFVVLVTPEKLVERLGTRSPLPIEIVEFALASATRRLSELGRPVLRKTAAGEVYRTDNGNPVVDLHATESAGWADPRALDRRVRALPGVVDTGFFFDLTKLVLVGGPDAVREIVP